MAKAGGAVREAPGRFRDIATPEFAALGGQPVAG